MPLITFVEPDGTRREVSAHPGESLMTAATRAKRITALIQSLT